MRTPTLPLVLFVACATGNTQRGTAPDGYYPTSYSGDTFTGKIVETEERKLALEYSNKSKTEQFVGVTTEPCMAPVKSNVRTTKELHLTAIPKGSIITVLYNTKKVKGTNGKKEEVHVVIGFSFNELNGEKLSNAPLIPCFSGGTSFSHYSGAPGALVPPR